MAWAAAAAVFLMLAASSIVQANEDPMLDSVLVIGSEQGSSSNKRKLLQQMSGEPEPLMKWLVTKHNELRYRHGVQLLTWDWSLAWNAYNYVVGCPKGHSGQQGIGENLAWGHNDFNHAMRDWYDEIQFYNFNAPGFGENTGHFSQLVWRDSAKIGCAANLRCSFRTYICQFTPPGNLVNYGGSVDINLWTTNVPAPGSQYVTGTKPDGTPSYMSYDPTGETTRGLPQPRYGELKNFGYVPKPGEVIVMTDWQKFIPTDIIQNYLPWVVLEQYLKPDILDLLKPEPAAVPKPGKPVKRDPERAVVGWQEFLPASVIKQYVPAQILAKYVPEGVVLATEKDGVGAVKTPPANVTAPIAGVSTTIATPAPSDVTSGSVSKAQEAPKEPAAFVAGTSGVASKPQDAPKEPSSFVAAASQIFSPPMKEDYESGWNFRPSRQLKAVNDEANEQDAVFFRKEPARAAAAQARQISRDIRGSAVGAVIRAKAAQQFVQRQLQEEGMQASAAASKASAVNEQGALDRLFGGLADRLEDNDHGRNRYGYAANAPQTPAPQPVYPVVNPTPVYPSNPTPGYAPVGHVPAQQPAGGYYVQQTYQPPQQQQQQPMTDAPNQYGQVPQVPQALAPQSGQTRNGYQQTAAVPLPTDQQGQTTAPQPAQQVAADDTPQGVARVQQLPAGVQDVLEAHNYYRIKHQVPAVAWDDQLAASAMGVASKCSNSPSGTQGIGENLAWGFRDAGAAVDEWYKEGKQYDFNNPGFTMTSGHFTQIVWADTQRIGCAMVPTCSMPTFICHYFPPGNVMGSDWSAQVKPALPAAPAGPRPRQPAAAALRPGYPYQAQQPVAAVPYPVYPVYPVQQQQQQQQQQPVAAVPYPTYPVQQQQQQPVQYQPVAAVPYPTGYYAAQQPQVPAVTAVPNPAYNPQQQQQVGQQAAQPVAAVLMPRSDQKPTEGHIATYPAYQTYQPYPVDAVPKPHQQFVPVVGSAGDNRPTVASARSFRDSSATPFSAPAVHAPAKEAVTHGTFRSGDSDEPRPVTAATTKPFSAPAFSTPMADAVPKPGALATSKPFKPQISSRGKLPRNAPVQVGVTDPSDLPQAVVDQNGKVIAAVGKPPFPVAAPRSHWPHVGRPVSNDGAPFSLSAPTQPAAAAVLSPELQQALDRHNQYRAAHQAPPLTWDDSIASSAQSWAAGCPDGHSGTRGVGENMAWGYSSLSDAVDAWYNEVKLYDFNNPGWNTATGHFTALVWKSTTKLGCAINAACSWPTYVCQYGPPGNVIGLDWSKEVMPKVETTVTPVTPSRPSAPTPTTAPKEPEPNTPAEPKQPPAPTPAPTKPSVPKTQEHTKPSHPSPAPAKPSHAPTKPSPAPKKPAKKPAVKGVQLTQEQKVALDKHNMYRAKHNAPSLAWDSKLAATAQAWADSCPWGLSDQPYGENMAWGYNSFADAMEAWYSEVKGYDWGYPAYQAGTGHFSQLVWRSSSKLGCAVSKKCEWKTYACMYDPAGNIEDDSWGSNVQPPTDTVPLPDSRPPAVAAVLKPGSVGEPVPVVAAVLKPEYQAALDRHNQYRQTHQAPALVWDDALAASAAQWAAGCPNGHSGYSGVGENMAWGYSSLTGAVDAWYNEVKQYDFSKPGWNTATGHFTAIVWKTTTKLGCATNSACSWATYVCQYQSPGNIIGVDWSQYVKPAVTAVPASPSPAPKVTPPPPSPSPKPAVPSPAPARSPSPAPVVKSSPAPVAKASPSPAPLVKASPVPVVKASPAPVAVAPSTAGMQQVLTMHNAYRKTHQAPALVWDEKLAASAKKWADTCTFGVSRTAGVGEALGFGYRTFPDAVTGWYNQVSKYDFNNPGWQSGSGLFTQMVWRDTRAVGCAVNTACSWAMYVCHYSPPGNIIGPSVDWSQQVKPAVTTAAVPKPLSDDKAGDVAPVAVPAEDEAWDAKDAQPVDDEFTPGMPDPLDSTAPITAAVGLPDSLEPADPDLVEALRHTNLYRKRHQVTPLSWDEGLAAQAATFLADCPLKHSYIRNVGESLGWGFRSFTDVVDAWYNEVNSYHFDKPGWSILAGHFSQMIWKDTTKIGCAVNRKCTWDTYICQYSPPGNVVSTDWSTQVLPALPDSPKDAQKLWNPTLRPGEAYYSPDSPGALNPSSDANNQDASSPADGSSSSTVPQYANPVPLDQLAQVPPTRQPVTPVTTTTPVTPCGDDNQDRPEIPVTPEVAPIQSPQQVTPVPPQQVAPLTPQAQDVGTAQQPYEVPTMPAEQILSQTGANSAAPNPAPIDSTISDSSSSSSGNGSGGSSSSGGGSSAVPGLDAELQAGLDSTNSYRRQHNAPDLVWDPSIAAQAANYVAGCPNGHSGMKGFGENLAWGYDSLAAAVKAWYEEVSAYDFNQGGFSGSTGHFTQLVWRDTTKVGCAVNKACSMPTYICQYSPPGNVMGVDWSTQVQPKTNNPAGPSQPNPSTPAQPAQPTPVTPSNPSWPQQQQQQQQQPPVQQSQPQTNWWDTPQQQQQQQPQQMHQQPADSLEPTTPTQVTPVPAQPTQPQAAPADGSAPAAFTVGFEATNKYRAKHGVPALTWDAALAARSQAYADACPGGHSGDKGIGENLAWGYPSWQSAVDAWYSEIKTYSFSNPGWSGSTGHFTQLVWKDTTKVGCGYNARCAMATYVCQYSPAGNVLGTDWAAEVPPATS